MLNLGVQYYLERDIGDGPVPRHLFLAGAAAQLRSLYPVFCHDPAACLGDAPRVWVITGGNASSPYGDPPSAQAEALQAKYHVTYRQRVPNLTVFLLVKN